jgi:hypothetical protein
MNRPAPLDMATEAEKIAALIETARRVLADGKSVDLSALEDKVRVLCEAAHHAPATERQALKRSLGGIIDGLDALAADLTEHHRSLSEGLSDDVRRRAAAAYARTRDDT